MSDTEDLKKTAVPDVQPIDTLKEQEKEKLAAAEEAYTRKDGRCSGRTRQRRPLVARRPGSMAGARRPGCRA